MKSIGSFIFYLFYFAEGAQLEQIYDDGESVCGNYTAEFLCSATLLSTNWIIRNPKLNTETFSFGVFFNSPVEILGPRSSKLYATTVFVNSSILISRVNLEGAIYDGSSVICNSEHILYYIQRSERPTNLNITILTEKIMQITWMKQKSSCYSVLQSTVDTTNSIEFAQIGNDIVLNITNISNEIFMLVITTDSTEIKNSSFNIGPCAFIDFQRGVNRRYTLDTNNIWTFETDPWTNMEYFCMNRSWMALDNSSINYIETNLTGVEVSVTELVEIKREIPIFIYILVAIIALFLFFTMTFLVTFITIAIAIRKRKPSKKMKYSIQNSTREDIYQHLSNLHHNSRMNIAPHLPVSAIEMNNLGNYSTLGHKIKPLSTQEPYDTVANVPTPKPSKEILQYSSLTKRNNDRNFTQYSESSQQNSSHEIAKNMKYSKVVCDNSSSSTEMFPSNINYSKMKVDIRPEDNLLNLDTLLIQLRPISDKYKLIGSIAGVSLDILNEIESHTAEPFDKLVEVCDYWLKQCRIDDIPLTWKAVADILTLIGQEQMSCGIMEVYATGKLPIIIDMNSPCPQQMGSSFISSTRIQPPHQNVISDDIESEKIIKTIKSLKVENNFTDNNHMTIITESASLQDTKDLKTPPPIPKKTKAAESYYTLCAVNRSKDLPSTTCAKPYSFTLPPRSSLKQKFRQLQKSESPPPIPSKLLSSPQSNHPPKELPPKLPSKDDIHTIRIETYRQ